MENRQNLLHRKSVINNWVQQRKTMLEPLNVIFGKIDGFSENVSLKTSPEEAFDILESVRAKGSSSVKSRNVTEEVLIGICHRIESELGNPDVIFYLPSKKFAGVFHSNLRWTFANLIPLIGIDTEQLSIRIPASEGSLYFDFTPFGEFDPGYAIFAHGQNMTSLVRPLISDYLANY